MLAFVLLFAGLVSGLIRSDASAGFVDEYGRQRVFHGVNAVWKVPPWIPPSTGEWNWGSSLVEKDFQDLQGWGFNMMRLGLMWPGLEVASGQFNASYLEQVDGIVSMASKHGIQVLLDMHQDLLSPKFCGEGMPDFLVPPETGLSEFPIPISLPYAVNSQGYPSREQCSKKMFADYYPSAAVSKTFQALYTNTSLQSHLIEFWKTAAQHFATHEGVLGYELINEPWFGDIYSDPKLLEPGVTDQRYLKPLYEALVTAIRSADAEHLIFFEPCVADEGPSGFDRPPGNDSHTVYSYHVYCPKQPSQSDLTLCKGLLETQFLLRQADRARIGTAGFMTEFGAVGDGQFSVDFLNFQTRAADTANPPQSWSYWQMKDFGDITTAGNDLEGFYFANGTLQEAKVKSLSRTYVQAAQGVIVPGSLDFNVVSGAFSVSIDAKSAISQPTEIFVSPFYLGNGFNVTATPAECVSTPKISGRTALVTAVRDCVISIEIH